MNHPRFKISEVHGCTGGADILILDRAFCHRVVRTFNTNNGYQPMWLRRAAAELELAKLNAWDLLH